MNKFNSDSQPHSQNKPNVPIITINKNKSVTIISLDKKKPWIIRTHLTKAEIWNNLRNTLVSIALQFLNYNSNTIPIKKKKIKNYLHKKIRLKLSDKAKIKS